MEGMQLCVARPQCLRVPGRRLHDLRERQHRDRLRLRLEDRPSASVPASTTRRPRWPSRAPTGGSSSGATGTPPAPRCGGSSSKSGGPPSAISSCSSPRPCWPPFRRSGPTARRSGSRCARRQPTPTGPAGRSIPVGRPCSRRHSPTAPPSCASSGSASGPPPCAGLMPALVGYLVAFAVSWATTDLPNTLEALSVSVANDEIVRRMTFAERVQRRRAERGFR